MKSLTPKLTPTLILTLTKTLVQTLTLALASMQSDAVSKQSEFLCPMQFRCRPMQSDAVGCSTMQSDVVNRETASTDLSKLHETCATLE